jgi:hypothetical protein
MRCRKIFFLILSFKLVLILWVSTEIKKYYDKNKLDDEHIEVVCDFYEENT